MTELSNINWKQTDDGKWLAYDESNTQITGWIHNTSRDAWYYAYSDDIAKSWIKDNDGRWYYFSPTQQVTYNHQYYVGEMMVNWIKIENKWYYLLPISTPSMGMYKGQMLFDTTEEINDVEYSFNKDGSWIEGNEGLSTEGAKFIEGFEGFSSVWEDVGDHYNTIGIGLCDSGTLGKKIYASGIKSCTHEQAYEWLQEECESCYKAIKSKVSNLPQCKIDALISMAYNIGVAGLLSSSLFKNICNGVTDSNTIYNNFIAWNKCNGVAWEGLTKRRVAEYNLFMNGDYTGRP